MTVERIRRAFPDDAVVLVAHDPKSFTYLKIPTFPSVWQTARKGSFEQFYGGSGGLINLFSAQVGLRNSLRRIVDASDLVVSVGGAFLRADSNRAAVASVTVHLPQLVMAAKYAASRSIYFPQSVGPIINPLRSTIVNSLSALLHVCVRDDRSYELLHSPNVSRTADLAVLQLVEGAENIQSARWLDRPILVGRSTDNRGSILFCRLHQLLPDARLAVQSTAGKYDDRKFYESHDLHPDGDFGSMIESENPGVVISVRLHASLEAILRGIPAIHLAYERKGWGAFTDLGLGEYVHSVYSFDPGLVARQVSALRADASQYWSIVKRRWTSLQSASRQLDTRIVDAYGG